jgi:hypothetical protein
MENRGSFEGKESYNRPPLLPADEEEKTLNLLFGHIQRDGQLKSKEDKSAFWVGMAFAIVAAAIPAFQAFLWLKAGVWTPLPISSVWPAPMTDWVGFQKILSWIFDLPLFVFPAAVAFACFSN